MEKTPEEKAKLLAESVALQRIDNAGEVALKTLKGALPLLMVGEGEERQVDGWLRGGGRRVRDEEPGRGCGGESDEGDRGVSVRCLLHKGCLYEYL